MRKRTYLDEHVDEARRAWRAGQSGFILELWAPPGGFPSQATTERELDNTIRHIEGVGWSHTATIVDESGRVTILEPESGKTRLEAPPSKGTVFKIVFNRP